MRLAYNSRPAVIDRRCRFVGRFGEWSRRSRATWTGRPERVSEWERANQTSLPRRNSFGNIDVERLFHFETAEGQLRIVIAGRQKPFRIVAAILDAHVFGRSQVPIQSRETGRAR